MMGSTHAVAGLALGAAYANHLGAPPVAIAAGALVAAFFALLPDIDHPNATISRIKPLRLLFFWSSHRGFTHTLLCAALVAALAHILAPEWAGYVLIGYLSHLMLDVVTHTGIPLLWPIYRANIRTPVHVSAGGIADRLCAAVALMWIVSVAYQSI